MNNAVEQKIQILRDKAAGKLLPIFDSDLPVNIQAKAILVLAKTKSSMVNKKILAFFEANPDVEEAIRALAEMGGDEAINPLVARVRIKTSYNRDIIAEELGRFKTFAGGECLKELLNDEDRNVRFQAANSLFNIGGRDSALALCRYIADPDEWISMSILKLLCRLKEHESIPFLAEQFVKDTDIRRKALMVSFLSLFRSVTLVNIFDEGLKGKDARLKANSIEAIGELELPQREISTRISPFLRDPNNRIRANSILALAKGEPENIRPEIVQMALSNDVQLRRSAAYILGQIPSTGNEELAEKLLVDPHDDVRRRMVLSLKKFPNEFAKAQLEKAVADQNKWIRKHSVDIASGFPDFAKAPILRQFKLETSYPNIVSCMEFFAKHPDEEAARLIRQRVKDKREQVVSAVIRSIGAMYGVKGLQAIAPQINYRDQKILKSFVVTHFSLGGLDIFDSILEKACQIKKPPSNDVYLPALDGCLEVIRNKDKLPAGLLTELSKIPVPIAPLPQPERIEKIALTAQPAVDASNTPLTVSSQGAEDQTPAEMLPPESFLEMPDDEPPQKAKAKFPPEFVTGVKYFNLGKYKKARKAFIDVLSTHPNMAKAHLYIGMMAFEEKEWESARESLSLCLENEPENMKALVTLEKVYKVLRDWSNVVRCCEQLLAGPTPLSEKTHMKMLRELGVAYIFLRKYSEAKDVLEKVFKIDPTDPETNFHLAMAYFHLQNYVRSETLLRDIIKQTPKGDRLKTMAESLLDKIGENLSQSSEKPEMPSQPEEQPDEEEPKPPAADVPGEEQQFAPSSYDMGFQFSPQGSPSPSDTLPVVPEIEEKKDVQSLSLDLSELKLEGLDVPDLASAGTTLDTDAFFADGFLASDDDSKSFPPEPKSKTTSPAPDPLVDLKLPDTSGFDEFAPPQPSLQSRPTHDNRQKPKFPQTVKPHSPFKMPNSIDISEIDAPKNDPKAPVKVLPKKPGSEGGSNP